MHMRRKNRRISLPCVRSHVCSSFVRIFEYMKKNEIIFERETTKICDLNTLFLRTYVARIRSHRKTQTKYKYEYECVKNKIESCMFSDSLAVE